MDAIDKDALERCLAACRKQGAARSAQLDAMLGDQEWERVAVFACSCVQCRSLDLPPWQSPVFRASLRDLDKPYGDASGKRESAELLRRLLDNNLSPFEPDPLRALKEFDHARVER
jgi:hypothetical protein